MKKSLSILIIITAIVITGCNPSDEGGLEGDYQITSVAPSVLVSGLNYPWGIEFVSQQFSDAVKSGSVLQPGNLLVTNRGIEGNWSNSVTQINPLNGEIALYTNGDHRDSHGEPAVSSPLDAAINGPFVWIGNDNGGLGSVAITDPNPSEGPNGTHGEAGDPLDGPLDIGVYGVDDFGFVVLDVYPEMGAESVPQNTKVEVVFSQPVDPETITADNFRLKVDFSPLSPDPDEPVGEFRFSSDYTRLELDYDGYLAEATTYEIWLDDDVTDYHECKLDGNINSPGPDEFSSTFTTGSGNPRVVWINPSNGASNVSISTRVEVGFSEPIRESSVTSTSFVVLNMEGSRIDGTIEVNTDFTRAIFVPDESLEKNATYSVNVLSKVEDLAGNPLDQIPGGYPDPFESTFSTGVADNAPPSILSIDPANGATGVASDLTIRVTFSENIDSSSRLGSYFTVEDSGGAVSGSIDWPTDSVLEFTPSQPFQDEESFTVTILDVLTDAVGNNLDGNNDGVAGGTFTSTFSTGFGRLYVTSSFPAEGDYSVSVSTFVYVNFSKAINPGTLTSNSFLIVKEANPTEMIPATVWANPGNMGGTLKPDALLEENSSYLIMVTADVTDAAGNPLDQEAGPPLDAFSARFTTGGEDSTPPCVQEIQPPNGAEKVPVGTTISVTFTEPIIPASVTNTTFILTGPSGQISGSFAFANSNTQVTFNPDNELIPSVLYQIKLNSGITDSSGNAIDGDCDGSEGPDFESSFTTGLGGIVINEVVVDPQQDWNDSEGGDGVDFNGIPGTGSVTTSDEWIEIYNASNQSFDLTNWTLEMIDTSPEVHVIGSGTGTEILFPATATISNFTPGTYLIIGNPVGSNNNECYFVLKNALGNIIDDVEIGDDPAGDGDGNGAPDPGEDGNADDISNEAVARFPNGADTDDDPADFTKQAATIGSNNNGVGGFGPNVGTYIADTGLIGISGITSAGLAPDNPEADNYLCFVAHAHRSAVYGIDFNNGSYYAFTGVTSPMGIEYVPFLDNSGVAKPGNGYLFVSDPEEGNIVRLRMAPSGPVGVNTTISLPDDQGKDSAIFLTFPNLASPVGLAYSSEYQRVYAACRDNGFVIEFDLNGSLTGTFDTGLGSHALSGIAVGNFGAGDVVFLTHTGGERVDVGDGPQGAIYYFDPHPE